MTTSMLATEWSHKIDADDIGETPVRTTISASPQERKDLARRMQVESVDSVEATLALYREPGNLVVRVSGSLKATVTQLCVVTLEPIQETIESDVEGWFAQQGAAVSLARVRQEKKGKSLISAELPILEEREDPEPIINGQIDVGELVAQHLSLSLNPYPHKEGIEFKEDDEKAPQQAGSPTRKNPFAALKGWKAGKDKEN